MKQKIFLSSLIAIFLISFLMTNVLAQIPNCSDYANDGYDCYSYDKCDPSTQIDALCSNQDYACCKPQVAGDKNNTSFSIENPLGKTSDIYTLIEKITNFLIKLAIVITPIIIIYAGFLYITAAGNEEKIKTAQKVLIWALIGFALVLIATGVPALIKQFLETKETTYNLFPFVSFALAEEPDIPEINVNIWELLEKALNWFFGIALVVAAIMLVYAGFNYVTAAGNEDKIKTASKTIIFALIGVAIALLAKGIPLLIQEFLQGNNSTSQPLNEPLNKSSDDNLSNIDLSQIPLGGYVFDPNAPLEDSCHWDNNAFESDPRCGGGGGGGKAEVLV